MSATLAVWRRRAGWLAAAGFFLAANAGFFFWYRATGQTRQEALEGRRVTLAGEASAAEREAERLEGQRRRLSQVTSAIQDFYGKRVGTRRATLAAIVDEIHATLKRSGIAPAEIGYTVKALPKLSLTEMDAGFAFAADYQKFKRLLEAFETGPRWIVVRDIALARDADVPGSVQVRMSIATYFAEDEEAERGNPSASAALRAGERRRS